MADDMAAILAALADLKKEQSAALDALKNEHIETRTTILARTEQMQAALTKEEAVMTFGTAEPPPDAGP
jgi:hypothetical protein